MTVPFRFFEEYLLFVILNRTKHKLTSYNFCQGIIKAFVDSE